MRKPRLLLMTDDPGINSGNGKYCREVTAHMAKDFEIVGVIGWNGVGRPHEFPFHIWPVPFSMRGTDEFKYLTMMVINETKPDVFFMHGDIWDLWFLKDLQMKGVRKVAHIAVDVQPLRPDWNPIWEALDSVAVSSAWGRAVVARDTGIRAEVVYEGINPDIFKPLPEERRAEQRKHVAKICLQKGLWDAKFILTMLARPMARKNLPAGIRAISKLGRKYKDIGMVGLYQKDQWEAGDHDMREYERRHLDQKMVKFEKEVVGPRSRMSDADVAFVLGYSDVLVFPTMHEGFGLPVLEAMACGCVPVATDCTTMPELLGDGERGLLARVGAIDVNVTSRFKGCEASLVDDYDLLKKIEYLHNSPTKLAALRDAGIAWAREQTWEKCAASLRDLIMRSLDQREKPINLKEV